MSYREPPEGWLTFGTHAPLDHGPVLEFSCEVWEDGLPLWERHLDQTPCTCEIPEGP